MQTTCCVPCHNPFFIYFRTRKKYKTGFSFDQLKFYKPIIRAWWKKSSRLDRVWCTRLYRWMHACWKTSVPRYKIVLAKCPSKCHEIESDSWQICVFCSILSILTSLSMPVTLRWTSLTPIVLWENIPVGSTLPFFQMPRLKRDPRPLPLQQSPRRRMRLNAERNDRVNSMYISGLIVLLE